VKFEKRDIMSCLLVLCLSITLGCSKKGAEQKAPGTAGAQAQAASVDTEKPISEIQALKDRFQVYYDTLKKKGGNMSGLTF
jgi:hypothetical protein